MKEGEIMLDEEMYANYLLEQVETQHPYKFNQSKVISTKVYTTSDILVTFDDGVSYFFNVRRHSIMSVGRMNERSKEDVERYFGRLLQMHMEDKCMSQQNLADKINTTQQKISMFINGKSKPSYVMLKRIADALGCEVDKLYLPISYPR